VTSTLQNITKTALCSGRDFRCWAQSGTQVSGEVESYQYPCALLCLFLSKIEWWYNYCQECGTYDHTLLWMLCLQKKYFLICFDEERTFQGGIQNSKESVWKTCGLYFSCISHSVYLVLCNA